MEIDEMILKLQNRDSNILGSESASKFAILLPLIEINGCAHVLFEVRAHDLRRQPGEICFPGGKIEETDINECDTAIRETIEELGVQRESIQNVIPLDYIPSFFGSIMYPFVGVLKDYEQINYNLSEVAEVFTVPLSYFQDTPPDSYTISFNVEPEQGFPFHLINNGENYNWQTREVREYFYFYKDKVIWGLTARILKHFMDITGKDV
ncbi:NUDIX hydrolase [Ectobacillus sp. sgz5001026]|uniref:NUDIX hydrolase n=1 Tax=Ectobacillus sp. sgz5001026 TaxID=3242473 RepID=UPI0036D34E6B